MFWRQEDLLSSGHADSDTEALQTDIQRFIAILGFCLMAVFALVQAIPVTSPEKNTVIEDLSHKAAIQKEELERLRSENEELKKKINRVQKDPEIAGSLKETLEDARRRLDHQKEKIDKLITEKIRQQKDLMTFRRLLDQRDKKIRELEREKYQVEQILQKTVKTLKTHKPETGKPEKKEPEKKPRKSVAQKGRYVAFESDRVFMDLLGRGKIDLFIKVSGTDKGFRVLKKNGKIDFKMEVPARGFDLWEVKESMVPSEILEGFRAWTTLAKREKILIVGLTPEISRQIRSRKAVSGRFIIHEEGNVTYSAVRE